MAKKLIETNQILLEILRKPTIFLKLFINNNNKIKIKIELNLNKSMSSLDENEKNTLQQQQQTMNNILTHNNYLNQ